MEKGPRSAAPVSASRWLDGDYAPSQEKIDYWSDLECRMHHGKIGMKIRLYGEPSHVDIATNGTGYLGQRSGRWQRTGSAPRATIQPGQNRPPEGRLPGRVAQASAAPDSGLRGVLLQSDQGPHLG